LGTTPGGPTRDCTAGCRIADLGPWCEWVNFFKGKVSWPLLWYYTSVDKISHLRRGGNRP
jgi:hypothetical protein